MSIVFSRPRLVVAKATARALTASELAAQERRDLEATEAEELAEAIVEAIGRASDEATAREIIESLESGDPARAIDALHWNDVTQTLLRNEFPGTLRDSIERAGTTATSQLNKPGVAVAAFDITRDQVTRWVRNETVNLIRHLGNQQVATISSMVRSAQQQGMDPRRLAGLIRQGDLIGLLPRDVNAVFNMLRRQIEAGVPRAVADRNAIAYSQRLLDARALAIARTELKRADTQGILAAWAQAREEGVLGWDQEVEWVALGPNPCEECLDLDGTIITLGELFPNGLEGPPDHPNCNCGLRLVPGGAVAKRRSVVVVAKASADAGHWVNEWDLLDAMAAELEAREDDAVEKKDDGKEQRLIFVRHAEAVPHGTPGYEDDQRPVTPEGAKKFKHAADGLVRMFDAPDLILTSPLARCVTTAEILAKRWDVEFKPLPELGEGATFDDLAKALGKYKQATLVLVGHGPALDDAVQQLLGLEVSDKDARPLKLHYGGAAVVDTGGDDGPELAHWLSQKVLRKLR